MRAILDQWITETGDKGEIPEEGATDWDKYRAEVDGWCTRRNSKASKAGGVLNVECFGKGAHILRSYVAEGGDMELAFRARSSDVAPRALQWGTIEDLRNPKFRAKLDFKADGKWRQYSVPFHANGYVALLTIDLGDARGLIEFDWIRVSRKENGRARKLTQWDFT